MTEKDCTIEREYNELLVKYKHNKDSNEELKLQLQQLQTKLIQQQKENEKLKIEVERAQQQPDQQQLSLSNVSLSCSPSTTTPSLPSCSSSPSCSSQPSPRSSPDTAGGEGVRGGGDKEVTIEGLQSKLKRARERADEETKRNEGVSHELDYTKQMLSVEGRTRLFLEERNSLLEAEMKTYRNKVEHLRYQLDETAKKLEGEASARLALQQAKESLEGELEDLTKSLFEEANSMVSMEAKQRHELAVAKRKLEQELEDTKNKLAIDQEVLRNLQERVTQMEKKRTGHRASLSATSALTFTTTLRASSHPNLYLMDTKSNGPHLLRNSPPNDEFDLWRRRSKSLSEPAISLTGPCKKDPSQQHDRVEPEPEIHARSEEQSEGSDWEIVDDGSTSEEDDNVLDVEMQGKINTKYGLTQFVAFVTSAKQEWSGTRLMDRLLREDVGPCLRLRMQEDKTYRKLLEAVWNNKIFLEPIATPQTTSCSGCECEASCRWRLRYSTDMEWKVIDDLCRERIVRACDFYSYLRNIRKGLVKKNIVAMYKEYSRLRMMMNFARVCAG